jgi:hypothetical protein
VVFYALVEGSSSFCGAMANRVVFNRAPKILFNFCLASMLYCSISVQSTNADLENFTKWLKDNGGKFRCNFIETSDEHLPSNVKVLADRRIHDQESVFMIPQSLLINSTIVDR